MFLDTITNGLVYELLTTLELSLNCHCVEQGLEINPWCNEILWKYRMVGNFRGVLIFIIFVVDSVVMKFPPTKINAYPYAHVHKR